MSGVDPDIGSSAIALWLAAGSAALLVFISFVAFDRTRGRVWRIGAVVVGSGVGAILVWIVLGAASERDLSAERRALELRATELNAAALAPTSPLACLDAMTDESVEAACEKAIFASPASVASATSYMTARLALLGDIVAYGRRGGTNIDAVLLPLRRAIEADRFGFVAHVLALRDGCSGESCKALALLQDPGRLRADLNKHVLDRYLDRYIAIWAQPPETPVADVGASQTATAAPPATLSSHKTVVDIDFPSADSIPPISIMNPEPKGPVVPGAAAAAAGAAAESTATTPKRSRKQAGAVVPRPVQPPAPSAAAPPPAAAVDPVWAPGTVPVAPQASAGGSAHAP